MQFHLQQQAGCVFYDKTHLDFIDVSLFQAIAEQPKTIKQMVDITGYERKEIAKHINKFILAGFAEKSDVASDRRMTLITITDEGQASYRRMLARFEQLLNQSLDGLTLKDQRAVLKYLNQLAAALASLQNQK